MSKSSDRLTELPVFEPSAACPNKTGSLKFDCVPNASWKPSSSSTAADYSLIPPPRLSNGVESVGNSKDGGVTSVCCQLVAGFLNIECATLSPHDLSDQLQLLILDCRPFVSYNSNHIRGALNVSCSDCITRKRLLTGRASLGDLVSGTDDAKEQYRRAILSAQTTAGSVQVVVYDDDTEDFDALPAGHSLRLVVSCLRKAFIDVYYIHGESSNLKAVISIAICKSHVHLHRLSRY
jgi:Rhodanese-like domain